jgi:hypothetical protein
MERLCQIVVIGVGGPPEKEVHVFMAANCSVQLVYNLKLELMWR